MRAAGRSCLQIGVVAMLGSLTGTLLVGPASGQQATPKPVPDLTQPATPAAEQSVAGRQQRDQAPPQITVGRLLIAPTIEVGERFDSNIFGSNTHDLADLITFVRPSVTLVSTFGEGTIALSGSGDVEQFLRHTDDNVGNVTLEGDGRLDILRGEYVEFRTGYQIGHESRFAADSEQAVQLAAGGNFARFPTEFNVGLVTFDYVRSRGLIGIALDASVQNLTFANEPTLNGGLAINSDRNRTEYTLTPRLSYELKPGYQAFVQLSGARNDYESTFDVTPARLRRNSTGYAASFGTQIDLGELASGEVYAGYLGTQYDDPRLEAVNGPYFGANILYNVRDSTSLTLNASRTVVQTILIGSPGAFMTSVDLGIEQELTQRLLLTADATSSTTDFEEIGREDSLYGITTGIRWQIGDIFRINFSGGYRTRQSSSPGTDFNDEEISLSFDASL